jgi:hypothetical protein
MFFVDDRGEKDAEKFTEAANRLELLNWESPE